MSLSNPSEIENLISQMQLRQPSPELDAKINELDGSRTNALPRVASARSGYFGWGTLVVTAIAAAVGGLLVGANYSSLMPERPAMTRAELNVDSATNRAHGITPEELTLTPVSFNTQAYELLHGHSINPAYADCDACHLDVDSEVFEGWFYGDEEFFAKSHHQGAVGKCSTCHVVAKADLAPNDGIGEAGYHRDLANKNFPQANCSSCHRGLENLQADLKTPHAEFPSDSFYHHFDGPENCSNCHVGGVEGKNEDLREHDDRPKRQSPWLKEFIQDQHQGDCKQCHVA
ncbi:MAG: hypothetical protein ACI87E_003593 [Mariniblastus sp.]|jgi:hypothetical protein